MCSTRYNYNVAKKKIETFDTINFDIIGEFQLDSSRRFCLENISYNNYICNIVRNNALAHAYFW